MMDKAKLCYIYFGKKANLDFKKLEKMSALEPKVLWAAIIFCDSPLNVIHLCCAELCINNLFMFTVLVIKFIYSIKSTK